MADYEAIVKTHPRIHLRAADVPRLRAAAAAGGTHAGFYATLIQNADACAAVELPETIGHGDNDRGYGDQLVELAMAALLTGEAKYLDQVRRFLQPMLRAQSWHDGIGLVTGHTMAGVACCYDWLHDTFTPAERARMRDKMIHVARQTYTMASEQRVWWHDMFLQNWCHVPTSALSYAAAALSGEVEEAAQWMRQADFTFTKTKDALSADGNCEEGQAYMVYAWEYILRYFDIARGTFGIDHWDCDYLRNAPYAMIYTVTPVMRSQDHFMTFGDGRRRIWTGPVHLLLRSADEYKDGFAQDFAMHLVENQIGANEGWMNMLWYNPSIERKSFKALPTLRWFDKLHTVFARSSWDADATMLGFKCTPNHTEHTKKAFPGRDLGTGHAHPDAASFQVYAFGEWMAIDSGYSVWKLTAEHNTVLVNGQGQLGGDSMWFDGRKTLTAEPCAITHVESNGRFDYMRADASGIYLPQAGLERFIRHVVFLKPHDMLIIDELGATEPSSFEWLFHVEDEMLQEGNRFYYAKNEARGRIVWLAPAQFTSKVTRQKFAFVPPIELKEGTMLSISPATKSKTATFVALASFYKGASPDIEPELISSDGKTVVVRLKRADGSETLSVDLVAGAARIV